ncbi:MAG: hypothetical protein Q9180_005322 [Flavoplaca navasiana]
MIRQLAEQVSPLPPEVKAFRDNDLEKRRNPTDDERLALLKSMCSDFQDDVCPEFERDKLLLLLHEVAPLVRLYITSLPHVNPQTDLTNTSRLDIFAGSSDIKAYLESEISKHKRLSMFTAKDTSLKDEIIRTVDEKAAGM